MQSKRSNTRLWTFGAIALGVAALALVFTTVFSSMDATATESGFTESGLDSNAEPPAQTSDMNVPADTATADTVAVTLTDGAIDVPQTVAAGSVVFDVTNDGQETHGFAIGSDLTAPAEVASLDGTLEAGQSKTLTAELEPGTYMVYLPVEGSQAQVSAQFTAEEQASSMK
jgi:hypothetical protein